MANWGFSSTPFGPSRRQRHPNPGTPTTSGASAHPVTTTAASAGAAATQGVNARAAASPSVLVPTSGGAYSPFRQAFTPLGNLPTQVQNAREMRLGPYLTTRRAERLIGQTNLAQRSSHPYPRISISADNLGPTGKKGYTTMAYVPKLGANKIVFGPQVAAGLRPGYQPGQASRGYSRGAVLHEYAHTQQAPDLTQPFAEGGADLFAMAAARRQGINYTPGNINNGYGQFRRTVRALPRSRAYTRFGQFGQLYP